MSEISTERLERPAGVTAPERQPSEREQNSRGRRRRPPPRPEESETVEAPEESPHQLDRMG